MNQTLSKGLPCAHRNIAEVAQVSQLSGTAIAQGNKRLKINSDTFADRLHGLGSSSSAEYLVHLGSELCLQ